MQQIALIRFAPLIFMLVGCASKPTNTSLESGRCQDDPARLQQRSIELQTIVQRDQDARKTWQNLSPSELKRMAEQDVGLRIRVAEIWAEGCFSKSADYAAAALVMQHGDSPDHYFQTYLWAKKAVELGDSNQKRLMALGIDRYLVNSGKKQLFASQARKMFRSECWCIQPVEKSFPDSKRMDLAGKSLEESLAWIDELNRGTKCGPTKECDEKLAPATVGTVPGLW